MKEISKNFAAEIKKLEMEMKKQEVGLEDSKILRHCISFWIKIKIKGKVDALVCFLRERFCAIIIKALISTVHRRGKELSLIFSSLHEASLYTRSCLTRW